jgi:hypothetical protein
MIVSFTAFPLAKDDFSKVGGRVDWETKEKGGSLIIIKQARKHISAL